MDRSQSQAPIPDRSVQRRATGGSEPEDCNADCSARILLNQYEGIFAQLYDEVFVTDGSGKVTMVIGEKTRLLSRLDPAEIIGKNVADLQRQGLFNPSATQEVLRTKRKAVLIQRTNTGKQLEVTGLPVFDQDGRITLVISACRDITQVDEMRQRIGELEQYLRYYQRQLSVNGQAAGSGFQLVGTSQTLSKVRDMMVRAAGADCTVLVLGESGVGKEVVVRRIHELSARRTAPFIKVNCGGIPEQLLESELYGYERGAFTGANSAGKMGLLELAKDGTIFLDEIGDMPLQLQVKLLEFLQDHTIRRVGGVKGLSLDVRVVAATNQDLEKLISEGKFRKDLYYRLNVMRIEIPPLRERREDIPLLADHFLAVFDRKYGRQHVFSGDSLAFLCGYDWPGNVREMQNFVERLVLMVDQEVITIEGLSTLGAVASEDPVAIRQLIPWKDALDLLERKLFSLAMVKYKTTREAAKALGVNQSTVVRKLKGSKIGSKTG